MYNLIKNRITAELNPSFLIIENESHKHRSRGEDESHFKVCIVSEKFAGVSTIDRHRLVNKTVGGESGELPCHALSLKLLTKEQFEKNPNVVEQFQTPNCLGGEKKNKN